MPKLLSEKGVAGFIFVILIIILANWKLDPQWAWLVTFLSIIAIMAIIGIQISNFAAGIIIDNRNRVSLSKFQMAAWTALIISALMASASWNLFAGSPTPLEIELQPEILWVMGIAATSLVATPTLLSSKTQEEASQDDKDSAIEVAKQTIGNDKVSFVGKLLTKTAPEFARWSDIFRGDEVGNFGSIDLGKIQQFLITFLIIGIYSAGLWEQLTDSIHQYAFCLPYRPDAVKAVCHDKRYLITALPKFSPQLVMLLGISHAGYLAYKAAPHSKTAEAGSQSDNSDGAVG